MVEMPSLHLAVTTSGLALLAVTGLAHESSLTKKLKGMHALEWVLQMLHHLPLERTRPLVMLACLPASAAAEYLHLCLLVSVVPYQGNICTCMVQSGDCVLAPVAGVTWNGAPGSFMACITFLTKCI